MKIEVAHGEIIDKHTILVIKSERILEKEKLAHVQAELEALSQGVKYVYSCVKNPSILHNLVEKLKKVNEQLWEVEDELRILESNEDFGEVFIHKARSVYFLNDERAALKKKINVETGSDIVEAKSYADYSVRKRDS